MNISPLSIRALHDIIDEYWEDSLANRSVDLASVKLLLFKSSIDAQDKDEDEILELLQVIVNNYNPGDLEVKKTSHVLLCITELWGKVCKRQELIHLLASNFNFFMNFELDCKENVS